MEMLTSLMVIGNHHSNEILTALDKSCQAEVIRIDLAWPLFLSKSGFDSNGLIDIPARCRRQQAARALRRG
jgi:hypothetical protein